MHHCSTSLSNKTQTSAKHDGFKSLLTPISIVYLKIKLQVLIHYLEVLSLMILCIRVLILSPKVLVRCYFVPFMANKILKMIRMYTMHPSSVSVMYMGITSVLVMLHLV